MRVPLVAANWKMHGSNEFLAAYVQELQSRVAELDVEVALFPPFVYLQPAVSTTSGSRLFVGAQNISEHCEGAYTGEVSAAMLKDVGCGMVLVGHSERRELYGETSEVVASKFVIAQDNGLNPVLCVGESLDEREKGQTLAVISQQLQAVIDRAGLDRVAAAVIAYEPVWAIGTGKTATPEQAQDVHKSIRQLLGEKGQKTRILYGGSVKAANAEALFSQPDIDGGLVGGASLDAKEFSAICEKALAKKAK
jgi:triosephosphate isomerase (TIM)